MDGRIKWWTFIYGLKNHNSVDLSWTINSMVHFLTKSWCHSKTVNFFLYNCIPTKNSKHYWQCNKKWLLLTRGQVSTARWILMIFGWLRVIEHYWGSKCLKCHLNKNYGVIILERSSVLQTIEMKLNNEL